MRSVPGFCSIITSARHKWLHLILVCAFSLMILPRTYAEVVYGTPGSDEIVIPSESFFEGVVAYEGDDVITISSDANVNTEAESSGDPTAEATAIAIDAGSGNDFVQNNGTVAADADADATAIGVSLTIVGNLEVNSEGKAIIDSSTNADATAIGIDGGNGHDTIENQGRVIANADAKTTVAGGDVDIAIAQEGNVTGAALSDASVTAIATTTGIEGGNDSDTMINRGNIDLVAASDATGVSVSVDVAGTMEGSSAGVSVSDASVTATAGATGISGGEGDDVITNDGLTTTTNVTAKATGVSVGLTVSGSMEGNVEGQTLSDARVTTEASAIGIDGGTGQDTIDSWSNLFTAVNTCATGVAVSLKVGFTNEGDLSPEAVAEGSSLSDASVTAGTAATGIDGGEGSDAVTNRGDIDLIASSEATGVSVSLDVAGTVKGLTAGSSVSDSSVTAKSAAVGIAGGEGDDTIVNEGAINLLANADTTAVSVGLTVSGSMEGNVEGQALSDASALASTAATGISGGAGTDAIANRGPIVAEVDSQATAVGVSVGATLSKEGSASGAALSDASVTASAAVIGIDGGEGDDTITNRGDIDLVTNSDATGVSVSLDVAGTIKGDAVGSSISDASVTADASAIGIDGGEGDDEIINDGLMTTTNATASATGVSVGLTVSGSMEGNVDGKALSDASVTTDASAAGIDGGTGQDTIDNWSALFSEVDASATGIAVSLGVGFTKEGNVSLDAVTEGSALSDASVTSSAAATGIDGGEESDTINNRGDIDLIASSEATGVSVSVDVAGTMKGSAAGSSVSDSSVTAKSAAVGIAGGEGDDTIVNEGVINLLATADATAVSVGLTVSGSMEGNVEGQALSDSSALANAAATAIKGGGGEDVIENSGAIVGNVNSSATAVGVGLDANLIIAKEGDIEGNISGAALSDASVTANASVTGMDGGEDNDTIDNHGDIDLSADSSATGVAVSLAVAGSVSMQGDVEGKIGGKALSDATTTAYAEAAGIDGDEGSDHIANLANFNLLQATASSTGVSASVNISAGVAADGDAKVNVTGSALSDARVTAEAETFAIKGGDGDDTIINSGDFVDLRSHADTTSVAASLDITGAIAVKGDADASTSGSAVSNSSANALTRTVAIDGGEGNDIISNTGNIVNLEANSTATSVSAGATISTVVAIKGNAEADITSEAVGDSRVTAHAAALGIDGGLGDDTIDNEGNIRLLSTADATGVAAELNVSASLNFKGFSMADVSGTAASNSAVLARAEATGIVGGWGQDSIRNFGDITLMNADLFDAIALGVSASLNISGNVAIKGVAAGTVEGVAASNATVTAEATATGIDGGGNDDFIFNASAIQLLPSSDALGVAASLNVSGNMVGETEGAAMSDASVTARSRATGIDGGEGDDTILNEGAISLMNQGAGKDEVDAKALGVAASLNVTGNLQGTAEGQALSKATTEAEAIAIGISGGSGLDDITNTAAIVADVDSQAQGVAVAANVSVSGNGVAEGGSLSDVSTVAKAEATGIDGGEDDDIIDNSGEIQLFSKADATSTAVSVTVSGTMRGQAGGEALSKSSSTADASATGISGGAGADEITNQAGIFADVQSNAKAVAVAANISVTGEGSAEGSALSDTSSTASALATGIDGGADDDIIINTGLIDLVSFSEAQATAVSVGLTGAMKGLAEGKSVADSSAEAIAQSIGIDGGEGNDSISSSVSPITTFAQSLSEAQSVSVQGTGALGMARGAAIADSSASSVSYSAGIDGGLGNDTIDNASEIKATARADAEASSTTVGVTIGLGVADTVGTGDSSATARAVATGIEGGEGSDRITNTATITAGGLENQGPMANAQAESTTVTVGIAAGLNMSEASSNAAALVEANAAGISSGSGDDWIYNTGDITVGPDPMGTGSMANASARSTTVDISVTLGAGLGESSSDTSSTAVANLAGIRSGSGDDWVYNTGALTVGVDPYMPGKPDAMTKATAASETVDVGITIGGSFGDASSKASATAVSTSAGIETGSGDDWIENFGSIEVFSSSEAVGLARTTKLGLTLGVSEGGAQSDASSLSRALATGIDSGGDADEILTDSELTVMARAKSTALSTATDYNILSLGVALQSAEANSSSTAEAIARGIDGGTGADTITASGTLDITADAFVQSQSRSSTVTGLGLGLNVQEAQARAETVANSLAIGIDGGEGYDAIHSFADITVNAISNASTQATSATNTGFNLAGASSGESMAGAATNVTATGIGIRGGPSELAMGETDADVITSEGEISVTTTVSANTQSTSTAESTTFIGAADGKAVSDASAQVLAMGIGINSGADNDTITNKNTLTVQTVADSSVKSTSNVDADVTFGGASSKGVSDASANVWAEATGIAGGSGDNVITNLTLVTIKAESIGSITANSYVDAEVTFGGASSKAASDASVTKKAVARGIAGDDGNDVITNYGELTVQAISAGTVTSESRAKAKATFGSTSSITTTAAALEGAVDAAGIIGGSGDDWIRNLGNIDSIADATLVVNNSSVATAKSTFGSAKARALSVSTAQGKASSTGISGDDGNDLIDNEGVVNTSAIANTDVKSATVAIASSTFGGASTVAASSNFAAGESTSKGITAGSGDDEIANKGLVTVEAGGEVKVSALTVSSDGPAYSDAATLALAYATGIDGGAGDDGILNTDTVFVKASPRISSATRTFGSGGNVDGKVGILLNAAATGITGGAGNDAIRNDGNVLVFVGNAETASAISENAVSGSTAITDNSFATPTDPLELVGRWIRITGGENPDFFTQVVAFDPQTKKFTLRDPLQHDLSSGMAYTLYGYGVKTPDIQSVAVTVGGRTRVDASTTALVQAKGIVGADGNDHIVNAGTTAVSAGNTIKSVALTLGRNIQVDTQIESSVAAVGIEGSDQSSVTDVSDGATNVFTDLSRKGENPEAIVGKQVLFKSGSSGAFSTVVTAFDPVTGTFTLAELLPAGGLSRGDSYILGRGSDSIANIGAIEVRSDSTIDASNWSLSFGSADIDSRGRAQAGSAGIRGSELDDFLQNHGNIVTQSTTDVSSTARTFVVFGTSDQELFFEAASISTGVDSGDGNDTFTNSEDGTIDTEAVSTANVEGVTAVFAAKTKNLVNATADATALALDLDQGNNVTRNKGVLQVSADAIASGRAISDFSLFGETDADADAIAKASAWGIFTESGENQVHNSNLIQVDAFAGAISFAEGARIGSEDDTSTVSEHSDQNSTTFVDESPPQTDLVGKWIRFLSGENEGFFTRIEGYDPDTGTITIADALPGDLKAEVLDQELSTVTEDSAADSEQLVDATLVNRDSEELIGKLVFITYSENDQDSTFESTIIAFNPDTGTITIADNLPVALNAEDEYTILARDDNGDVVVISPADRYSFSAAGDGASASVASALVLGIDLRDDNGLVVNTGTINVSAVAHADTTANASDGLAIAAADAFSEAWGLRTGSGDDVIRNTGLIDVDSVVGASTSGATSRERAVATGIDAGDGNNKITNEGEINVTASVDGSNGEAKARGIITGGGDDTILNSGTIITSTVTNGTRELGIAIATGAGNDTVTLAPGTHVEGSIDLGDGNDALALSGSPMVIGEVSGGSGTDSLVFKGAGSVNFGLSDFEVATKRDPGTFTVASLTTMQRLEVDQGTLQINSNYTTANDGTFQADVNGDGSHGQLQVNGIAQLAGDLNVIKGPGPYINGTTYDIIEADTLNGSFNNITLPASTVLVNFEMNQLPGSVEIEASTKNFTTVAGNRIHWVIGNYLDRILPSSTGDLSYMLGEFQNLSSSQFDAAFSSLSPDSYNNATAISYQLGLEFTRSLQGRMGTVRLFSHAQAPTGDQPVLLAFAGSNAGIMQFYDSPTLSQVQGQSGLWFNAFGQRGDQDSQGGYTGYDYSLWGGTIGFDHAVTDRLIVGLSAGLSEAEVDQSHQRGEGRVKNFSGAIYGTYFINRLYLDGAISFGKNRYENHRLITIGPIQRNAHSNHEGNIVSAYLGGGYTFDLGRWLIGPFGTLSYTYLREDGFTETGADSLNLMVDKRNTDSLVSDLGLRAFRIMDLKNGILIPELSTAWNYDFDIDDRVIRASFAGSPGTSFSIPNQDVEKHGATMGAGVTYIHKSGISTSIGYLGEIRKRYRSHGIKGEIRFNF